MFISRFEEAYDLNKLSKLQQLIAVGASHHRLLWHCCLIKIPQRNEEQITEKASNIEFAAH
jgi:hypothetical protein